MLPRKRNKIRKMYYNEGMNQVSNSSSVRERRKKISDELILVEQILVEAKESQT